MTTKPEIRQQMRQIKKQITFEERQRQSIYACRQVLQDEHWQQAQVVMLYHALPDEVDTQLLLDSGKQLVLPVVVGNDILLKKWDGNTLRTGAFHIMEPDSEAWFTDYNTIDLVVVPGVAFTSDGKRLGRGKGYYDRFLPLVPNAYKIGICYQQQLIADIPIDEHDQLMDAVISYQKQGQS